MDNVIGWVHMLEDETIINRFSGEELAVTTGLKARIDGWLLHLCLLYTSFSTSASEEILWPVIPLFLLYIFQLSSNRLIPLCSGSRTSILASPLAGAYAP